MMIRQSTQHGERVCRRCTKTIIMKNKEEIGVVVVESDWRCIEGRWPHRA
jgi:hypothetical protein